MNICVISNMYPSNESPNYGVFVKNFIENLEKQTEFNICKIVIKGKGRNFLEKLYKYFLFYIRVFAILLRNNVDLFYIHYANHSLLPFLFFKKKLNKCIVNYHGGDLFPENLFSKIIQLITRDIVVGCRYIVVPSIYFKQIVSQQIGIDESLIFVSPSGGINTSLFSPKESKIKKQRKHIEIGFFGRLDVGKGFELIISLAQKLRKNNIPFVFSVIGGGSLMKKFVIEVDRKGLSQFFKFYGMQPQEKVPSLLRELDVLIFPSYRESLGLVGLEAMACGIPVIGSNIGGISSYVIDGENGFLFEPKNVQDLFEKFVCFVNLTEKEREKFRQNAINMALKFDSLTINKKMIKFLSNLEI